MVTTYFGKNSEYYLSKYSGITCSGLTVLIPMFSCGLQILQADWFSVAVKQWLSFPSYLCSSESFLLCLPVLFVLPFTDDCRYQQNCLFRGNSTCTVMQSSNMITFDFFVVRKDTNGNDICKIVFLTSLLIHDKSTLCCLRHFIMIME